MIKQPKQTWETLLHSTNLAVLPESLIQFSFFADLEQRLIFLSPSLFSLLEQKERPSGDGIPFSDFSVLLNDISRERLKQGFQELSQGVVSQSNILLMPQLETGTVPTLCLMTKLPEQPLIFSLVYRSCGLKEEYQDTLNQTIEQLRRSQTINQLILEGSTDYVYHLDVVNNVCTFSPKALDVLPLESPTFDNAMERILSFIVPEDRQIFLDTFMPFLTGQSPFHTAEYRVNTKQGNIMWISCHGKGVWDEHNRPIMIAGSLIDITEAKKADEQLHKLLNTDSQTGLKNRYCYEQEMEKYLQDPDASGSILCIDIHNFKLYNEIYGHTFGNRVLTNFAGLIRSCFPDCLGIYRLGGDEFLLHLQESDPDAIRKLLAPFLRTLKKAHQIDGHSIYIDALIGVAIYPLHGKTPEQLLKNADTILYEMSRFSHDTVAFYEDESGTDLSRRYNLEHALRTDIDAGFRHFRVVYQPITKIDKEGASWCSAEALLRYSNPELPNVTQTQLIETLEVSGLIIPVGRWVLTQAIQECSRWNTKDSRFSVHVNFAAQQMSDVGIFQHIVSMLRQNHLSARNLVCELTESSMIDNFESASRLCRELMNIGAGIALDDFGTGYTSFNYLRDLPISQIKIDRTYVQDITSNEYNRIIIKCLYDLSRSMGLELCIEGVENKETLDILTDMGASIIQGFYFGHPMEPEVICKGFTALG